MFANIFYEMNFNPSDDFNEFKIVVDYYNAWIILFISCKSFVITQAKQNIS